LSSDRWFWVTGTASAKEGDVKVEIKEGSTIVGTAFINYSAGTVV